MKSYSTIPLMCHLNRARQVSVLTFLVLLMGSTNLSAKSFDQSLSLNVQEYKIEKVLKLIQKQTEYVFFYRSDLLENSPRVSLQMNNTPIEKVLDEVLKKNGFSYEINDKTIIITKRHNLPKIKKIDKKIAELIKGVVNDPKGEPIVGALVIVKGTTDGAITDIDGKFELQVSEGDVLQVSFIGYATTEVTVNNLDQYLQITMKEDITNLNDVIIVGSRTLGRTDVDRPVPVDIINSAELVSTGQTDLGQMIQFTSPSFNSAKYGVNGTTNYAEPATLRGLSPDQSLVLINGKRRHQFSALQLNVAPGLGTIVTDLNSIPSAAVKRLEVLRDGAAAQYGSDAIAGIINLALNDRNDGGTFQTTAGIHKEGDGVTFKNALNYGFSLGKENSFFNFTLEQFSFSGTNRSDPYSGTIYPDAPDDYATTGPTPDFPYFTDNPRADRGVYPQGDFVVGNYGSNENDTYQAFVNTSYPISEEVSVYAFGGVSRKDILAFGFYRNPARFSRAVLEVFPDGYVPELPGRSVDYSGVFGIKRKLATGWNMDFSGSFGHNHLDLWANNTTNPSLGAATPTEFKVGQYEFNQLIGDASFSKNLGEVAGMDAVNLAFGGQIRRDRFQLHRGSDASYEAGPLKDIGKDIGSSARPGISNLDENDLDRTNVGIYTDVEADVSDALLVGVALRYENYSDFGGNLSGKLSARYKILDNFAIRGSYNRGFRAPSLGQIGNRVNTSTVQNGNIVITKQVSSDTPELAQLGIEEPEAEISDNVNFGFTAELLDGDLLLTIDAFQINIDDRIVISERLNTGDFPAVAALFDDAREIRFFTNHISTRTRGIDIVASYKKELSANSSLNLSLAAAFNGTDVTGQKATPSQILAGAAPENQDIKLLNQTATELIEVAVPREKILLSGTFRFGKLGINGRATRFGEVKAFSRGLSDEDSNVECDEDGRCVQTFEAKIVSDLSLSYFFNNKFSITFGSNNIFDVYPDKYNNTADGFAGQASSYASGQIPYSRNSNQFGFNGAYYYLTANINF